MIGIGDEYDSDKLKCSVVVGDEEGRNAEGKLFGVEVWGFSGPQSELPETSAIIDRGYSDGSCVDAATSVVGVPESAETSV